MQDEATEFSDSLQIIHQQMRCSSPWRSLALVLEFSTPRPQMRKGKGYDVTATEILNFKKLGI